MNTSKKQKGFCINCAYVDKQGEVPEKDWFCLIQEHVDTNYLTGETAKYLYSCMELNAIGQCRKFKKLK